MESKTPPIHKKFELPGISEDILRRQMPLVFLRSTGREEVGKLTNDSLLITGFAGGRGGDSDIVNFIYRFNPSTQTAELLYFDPLSDQSGKLGTALVDKIESDKNMTVQEVLKVLAAFMGISTQKAKNRFREVDGCDEAVINKSFASRHPQLNISFKVKGQQPATRFTYNYLIDTDKVALVYTNDGINVWREEERED